MRLSLPLWERGLKSYSLRCCGHILDVAPLVGAWIEIKLMHRSKPIAFVAPLVGAWIEIVGPLYLHFDTFVAPLVGAWIEIFKTLFCTA